ncbi:MAG TPA: hypothetical protein VEI02_14535 [Planctomycetota bacterium]|nr:hypothetical protein [Planctomycetota bacterium]
MAALGLLKIVSASPGGEGAKLGFEPGADHPAWLDCATEIDPPSIVANDARAAGGAQPWKLEYGGGDAGGKRVADLKPPPAAFRTFLAAAIDRWLEGDGAAAEYAAAYGTDVAKDGKGNTKPTALHFTAGQQQFLATVDQVREMVTEDWSRRALMEPGQARQGANLRWGLDADRNRALLGFNPSDETPPVTAPLDWLAFRALPLFVCVPIGDRIMTACVTGRRQDDFRFTWPLWSTGADLETVRSLLTLPWRDPDRYRPPGDVFSVLSSAILRSAQGYGCFAPPTVFTR